MAPVGIVTDSTCDMDPSARSALGVRMVPLKVLFGEAESYRDWIDLEPEEFYRKLQTASTLPKTSQPSPADFLAVYHELADEGCDSIVSIHLSAALSGTMESALMAAKDSPIPVHCVDSRKVSQGLALVVEGACEARDAGEDGARIAARAEEIAGSMKLLFVLDTLDYLVKGGRAGKAQGLAAALLNIKPVLEVNEEGIVAPFMKVKGRKRALSEIADHVAKEAATRGRLRVRVLHACIPDGGAELADELASRGADIELAPSGLVGAVIGTYTGPMAIGCAYYPV